MLNRPKYPKQRNVFLINDVPNKVELENEEKWSSTSNLNYITSLRTGKILNYSKSDEIYPYPIKSTDIYTSYLDMDYYGMESIDKNYDFNKEILQYKDLTKIHENDEIIYVSKEIPDLKFIKLEYFKDLYLSERLYNQFNNLLTEIREVKPLIIVTSGKWITMLLTGLSTVAQNKGKPGEAKPLGIINTYRTSLEKPHESLGLPKCIIYPMIHPVNIHTMPDKHYLLEMDLQKLGYTYHKVINDGFPSIEDNRKYIIKPDKSEILNYLDNIIAQCDIKETIVSIDIETLFFSIIDCIGITTKITEGICIPFSENGKPHYWSLEDETDILLKIYDLFTHKNCIHLGQNYSYEIQNYLKSWGLNVPIGHDTLVLHHILYNYLPKDLGFLASIYSEDYRYWKNERNESSEVRWTYNIKDICYTLEVFYNLYDILQTYSEKTQELYRFQLDRLSPILIERMYKGIRVDKSMKDEFYTFFSKLMEDVTKSINDDMGFEFNINSTPQKKKVFKDLLQMDLEKKRVKNSSPKETCDAASMLIYMDKYPLYKPLLLRMLEYGSLKVFTNTFLKAELEPNGRMATSYKISGTATGRLSSSKNIWGRGCLPIEEAEAYTPNGWVKLKNMPDEILQYTEEGKLEFVKATWNIYPYNGELYSYSGRCFRGDFTPEHRIVKSKRNKLHIQTAEQVYRLNGTYAVPVTGYYLGDSSLEVSDNWLQRYVMLSADGSKEWQQWRIDVKKQKKKDRILELVPEGRSTKTKKDYLRIKLKDEGYTKVFPRSFLNLPLRQRILFIEELKHWDAHIRGKSFMYFTTIPENADLVHTMCHLSGYSASITIDETNSNEYGNTSTKPLYTVNVSPKKLNSVESFRWYKTHFTGEVGCPTVGSGMWLVRYKGGIHITGNCNLQNIPSKGKINLIAAIEAIDEDDEFYSDEYIEGSISLPNVKKMFLPDVGYEIADLDFDGADIRVVAAEAGCKWLLDFFENPQGKVYKYISSLFYQREITDDEYKTQKAIYHGCVTGDHEVLTKEGWVTIKNYDRHSGIAIWDKDTKNITFESPLDFYEGYVDSSEDLYKLDGDSFSFLGTQNHKFPYKKSNGTIEVSEVSSLYKSAKIPYNGNYTGGRLHRDNNLIRLIVAFQADGTVAHTAKNGDVTYAFRFAKQRKIDRLTEILISLNIDYTQEIYDITSVGNPVTRIAFKNVLLPEWKYPSWDILNWSRENIDAFLEEVPYWDGNFRTSNGIRTSISSTNKLTCEIIQTIAHLSGKGSKILTRLRDKTRQTIYEVSINNRSFYHTSCGTRGKIKHKGTTVYCPSTRTGFFLCRRNGNIYVSGNSNYGLGIAKLAVMGGIDITTAKKLQDFYFTLNPEIKKWQEDIQKQISKLGYIENIYGRRAWFVNKNDVTLLNKALAFKPQSTIGDSINRVIDNVVSSDTNIDMLLQVHDSGVFQYLVKDALYYRNHILEKSKLVLDFNGIKMPLPTDIKWSQVSYGDCK